MPIPGMVIIECLGRVQVDMTRVGIFGISCIRVLLDRRAEYSRVGLPFIRDAVLQPFDQQQPFV